jgi:hypothetical protein
MTAEKERVGKQTPLGSLGVVASILVLSLCITATAHSRDLAPSQLQSAGNNGATQSSPISSAPTTSARHREIARYAIGLGADRGLNLATVFEQAIGQFSGYLVELQLASGAEETFAVTAPPGGLQLEVRDMTGDNVRNDLVLTPALVGSPPTVLLNDGDDHFTVAISGDLPNSLESKDRASGAHNVHDTAALLFAGSKASGHANRQGLFCPLQQISSFHLLVETATRRSGNRSSSGRAPPTLVTNI